MSDATSGGASTVTIALRGGESLTLWPDRLSVAGTSYPVAEMIWAGPVADPAGVQPGPAVGLRMRDGAAPIFVPADPPDTWRLLDAVFARRPDLRVPPPPPGYAGYGGYAPPPPPPPPMYGYGYGYAYAPYGQPMAPVRNNETTLAGISHLSVFFAPVILPLIVWLVSRENAHYAARQAKQAFFFHLGFAALAAVTVFAFYGVFFASVMSSASNLDANGPNPGPAFFASFFGGFVVLWLILLVASVFNIVFSIIGAVQAFQGKDFHYPLLGGL